MALAVLRGCRFEKSNVGKLVVYMMATDGGCDEFALALHEVGKALGYGSTVPYNDAYRDDPREVRRRIRAL